MEGFLRKCMGFEGLEFLFAISSRVGLALRLFAVTCHQKVYGTPACFGFCCFCWHDLVCCDLFWYCGPNFFANQPWEPVSSIQGCDPARKPVTGQVNSVVNHLKERWEIAHISSHILRWNISGRFSHLEGWLPKKLVVSFLLLPLLMLGVSRSAAGECGELSRAVWTFHRSPAHRWNRCTTGLFGWTFFRLVWELPFLPSGKHTKNYGKSPFFMGKLTINGHFQ